MGEKSMRLLLKFMTVPILLMSASTQAFELGNLCKETDLFYPIEGSCDKNGFLQGDGVASLTYEKVNEYYELSSSGLFNDGLPQGKHVIKGPNNLTCNVEFNNGQLLAKGFTCKRPAKRRSNNRDAFTYNLKVEGAEGSISVKKEKSKGWKIKIYMAQIEVTSDLTLRVLAERNRDHLSPEISNVPSTFSGYTDILEISLSGNEGLAFDATNVGTIIDDPKFTLEGVFLFRCASMGWCSADRFDSRPVDGAIDSRALFKYTDKLNKRLYEIAFVRDTYSGPSPIYFKDDKGVTFNGMRPQCKSTIYDNKLIHADQDCATSLKVQCRKKSENRELSFKPRCGEVTMPDGRSFDGFFDPSTGSPIVK